MEETEGFRPVERVGIGTVRLQVRMGPGVGRPVLDRVVVIVWPGEGEDFLVARCREGDWSIGRSIIIIITVTNGLVLLVQRMDGCWELPEAVLHPALKHPWIPGLVEGTPSEALCCGLARRPDVSPMGGEDGVQRDESVATDGLLRGLALDDWI